MAAWLTVEGLQKSYGALAVLRDLNLQVGHGERVVLLGPSGCGKTTLLRVIAGLERPSAGAVWRHEGRLGFVFQEPRLLPWRSVEDNLRFVNPRAECRGLLAQLGLGGFEHCLPARLSGGMQQRVNLARALVADPSLLIMDEAFSALDLRSRAAAMADVQRLWSESRFAMLAVAHDPKEALLLADRIVLLSRRPATVVREMTVELGAERSPSSPDLLRLEGELVEAICASDA